MNRFERLMAILLELQARRFCCAETLAEHFGVSVRTIYRDIHALYECGVPIESEAGVGYRMAEGYFLPPLMLTPSEASSALLGLDFVARNFDSEFRQASLSAHAKIRAILSSKQRNEVAILCKSMHFLAMGSDQPKNETFMCSLRRAILGCYRITIHYEARFSHSNTSPLTTRQVNPYGMLNIHGIWYLTGFCHLRSAMRMFRLDRIHTLKVETEHFERPHDFNFNTNEDTPESRSVEVCVLFDHEVARRVKESGFYFQVAGEDCAEGYKATLHVRHEDEILSWLLGWGSYFQVLSPKSLQRKLLIISQTMAQKHTQ